MREIRAIRGAITVPHDDMAELRAATRELLTEMLASNDVCEDDLVSALFSTTPDLTSGFPAEGARELGWHDVPLLCASEIAVAGALPRCIRVLVHVMSSRPRSAIRHVYLRGATVLRPEYAGAGGSPSAPRGEQTLAEGTQ